MAVFQKMGRTIVMLLLLGLIGLGLAIVKPAGASPQAKPLAQPTAFLTPTPGPDGRIVYIVQKGDSLWRIAAIAGITVEELMSRNGIQPGDYITEGMELELGIAAPARPTEVPGAEPTEISPQFSPTPISG
ncbi:MAG TPA: LysM peptidoglycan-binding domain-containing protein, partial [Anaerolineae bacterium]|nr:LysM peptidoglycan-binding domain-containing protein [Anaerolineae bacterium]